MMVFAAGGGHARSGGDRVAGIVTALDSGVRTMSLASFTMVALLGLAPGPDPSALVEQLGSARYADRERAAASLLELKGEALPALRSARAAKDAEVRARASSLLDRIESELMVRPTMLALDFRDAPLTDVVKSLGERCAVNLILQPDVNAEVWKGRKVTLKEDEPVTFWDAIDRLCAAGQLQFNPNMHNGVVAGRLPTVTLWMGGPQQAFPAVDSGPFRVSLMSVHHHRDVNLQAPARVAGKKIAQAPAAIQSNVGDQFYFQMQIIAEPRLFLAQGGMLRMSEAVDDKGQSLLIPANDNQANRMVNYNGYNPFGPQSLQVQGFLKYPERPGKTLKTLKGSLPVAVATRKDDPLVITLAGSAGKTFRTEETTLIYHETKLDPNGQGPLVEITIRQHGGSFGGNNRNNEMAHFLASNNPQNQLELLDAQGKALQFYNRGGVGPPGDMRMTLGVVNNGGDAGAPAQIRYYDLTRAAAEASFEFHDVPMP